MHPLDFVIVTAALDDRPFSNVIGCRAERVTHIGLLKDPFVARAGTAVGEELFASERCASSAIDELDQTLVDCIFHGHAEIHVPRDSREKIGDWSGEPEVERGAGSLEQGARFGPASPALPEVFSIGASVLRRGGRLEVDRKSAIQQVENLRIRRRLLSLPARIR